MPSSSRSDMVAEQRGRQASGYEAKKTDDCWTDMENDTEDQKEPSGPDGRSFGGDKSWETKGTPATARVLR